MYIQCKILVVRTMVGISLIAFDELAIEDLLPASLPSGLKKDSGLIVYSDFDLKFFIFISETLDMW